MPAHIGTKYSIHIVYSMCFDGLPFDRNNLQATPEVGKALALAFPFGWSRAAHWFKIICLAVRIKQEGVCASYLCSMAALLSDCSLLEQNHMNRRFSIRLKPIAGCTQKHYNKTSLNRWWYFILDPRSMVRFLHHIHCISVGSSYRQSGIGELLFTICSMIISE